MSYSEWETYKLGDLVESISVRHAFNKTKLIFLNTSDILNGKVLNKSYADINTFPGQAKKSIKKGDILFSEIRPKNKRFALVNFDADDYVVSTKLMVLRRKSELIDNKFLYFYLTSDQTINYLQSIAEGRSGTFPQITFNELRDIKIKLPDINEQKAIANILSTLDEKIETNNQINEKLEEMAQALFKHWFVDFEFPNENGEPYKSSGGEMVDSELGMIPKGWEVGKLGELVEISNKSIKPQEYPEKFFEHYSIPAFDNGKTPEFQKGKEIKSNKYVINNHVVLVSKLNPSTKRIWKPITQTKNAICSTEFIVYMSKKGNILSYVFEYLNNEKFQGVLTANATGSTGSRQRVKPKETLNYKVVLPPLKLMQQFSRMIEPMHLEIGSNMIENQKIKGLRDILLPKLMSGEIRVPLDDEVLSEKN
jgi:type I restriction enzyme S subunit